MKRTWTFGQKLGAGYAVMVLLVLLISAVAVAALRATVAIQDQVINVHAQSLLEAQRLNTTVERMIATVRGYALAPEERFLTNAASARAQFAEIMARLRAGADSAPEGVLLRQLDEDFAVYQKAADELIGLVRGGVKQDVIVRHFDTKMLPARDRFDEHLNALNRLEEDELKAAKASSTAAAERAVGGVLLVALLAVLFALAAALLLARMLSSQVGAAVGHVQSSSAELQAAASQQASGAKQQASAMTEITTTISELVATSRQIAESAQRVAQIAEQTAAGARHGEGTVDKGQEAIAAIRRQIDQVVAHMLDLGRKSQEIGAVLDIVAELAEQTNILAINATIEASGAGEAGRRFAVVAEEIRKLADRVAASTKGIRTQIEDVRGAVNTTVMATESGAKAVDAGARQFSEVAQAFKQIAALVATTTEAAREIELSTKQQASAAEQVRIAVTDVAQATRETETSSTQTLQTAATLAALSLDLRRLIQPQGG